MKPFVLLEFKSCNILKNLRILKSKHSFSVQYNHLLWSEDKNIYLSIHFNPVYVQMSHIVFYHDYLWHGYFFQISFVWSFLFYVRIIIFHVRINICTIRSRLILSKVSISGTYVVHNYQFKYLSYCTAIIRTTIVFRSLKLSTLLISNIYVRIQT